MGSPAPRIGDWYQTPVGDHLEVVAYDPDEQTIEVQFFDGAVDEYDLETWDELELENASPPEDWLGAMDLPQEAYESDRDYTSRDRGEYPDPYDTPEDDFS